MLELSFREFIEQIKSYGITTDFHYSYGREKYQNTIGVKWDLGGVSGGSCWDNDDSNLRSYTGDPEPDFADLDVIIEKISPEINFLTYKRLYRDLLVKSSYTENEYYGNYTKYGIKYVDLKNLYNWLTENNLIKVKIEPEIEKPIEIRQTKKPKKKK